MNNENIKEENISINFNHVSVMPTECIENLDIKPNGIYVDGTLGGAGHSSLIAKQLNKDGLLIGIDQDDNALTHAKTVLKDFDLPTIKFVKNNFSNLTNILDSLEISKISGILLDLGVSSHQLDESERGFSYMKDASLDMRMDRSQEFTAYDVVNTYDETSLIRILKEYGEEKWAVRIAKFIIEFRNEKPIKTTLELVDVIQRAIPKSVSNKGSHPAKKTFQAIRIEVNNELKIIEGTIKSAVEALDIGGRICIITFHSLEDRIVKNAFRNFQNPCTCPSDFPVCVCGLKPQLKLITRKPLTATNIELENNSRSKSAKLRVAEKI